MPRQLNPLMTTTPQYNNAEMTSIVPHGAKEASGDLLRVREHIGSLALCGTQQPLWVNLVMCQLFSWHRTKITYVGFCGPGVGIGFGRNFCCHSYPPQAWTTPGHPPPPSFALLQLLPSLEYHPATWQKIHFFVAPASNPSSMFAKAVAVAACGRPALPSNKVGPLMSICTKYTGNAVF